jgi:hypothetical protein
MAPTWLECAVPESEEILEEVEFDTAARVFRVTAVGDEILEEMEFVTTGTAARVFRATVGDASQAKSVNVLYSSVDVDHRYVLQYGRFGSKVLQYPFQRSIATCASTMYGRRGISPTVSKAQ